MAKPVAGALDLTQAAWQRFQSRWAGGVILSFLTSILAALVAAAMTATFVAGAATNNQSLPFLGLLALLIGFFVLVYASGSLLAYMASDQPISIGEALRQASARWRPLVITSLTTLTVVLGGTLFLIIPGIILAIYFSQSQPVALLEDKQGMAALARSRALTNGRWWAIVGRYIFLALLLTVVTMAVTAILRLLNIGVADAQQWANLLTNLVAGPLIAAYIIELYHSLKGAAAKTAAETGLYRVLSVLGGLIVLLWLASLTFFTGIVVEFTQNLRQAYESGQSTFTVNGLEFNVNDFYPESNSTTENTADTTEEGTAPTDPSSLPAE